VWNGYGVCSNLASWGVPPSPPPASHDHFYHCYWGSPWKSCRCVSTRHLHKRRLVLAENFWGPGLWRVSAVERRKTQFCGYNWRKTCIAERKQSSHEENIAVQSWSSVVKTKGLEEKWGGALPSPSLEPRLHRQGNTSTD